MNICVTLRSKTGTLHTLIAYEKQPGLGRHNHFSVRRRFRDVKHRLHTSGRDISQPMKRFIEDGYALLTKAQPHLVLDNPDRIWVMVKVDFGFQGQ